MIKIIDWRINEVRMMVSANLMGLILTDMSGGKRRAPPKAEKLVEFHSDVVKKTLAKYPDHPLILAGKSMGSRQYLS